MNKCKLEQMLLVFYYFPTGKNMTSKAGVGVLIGGLSLKPLLVDTRVSSCGTCEPYEKRGEEPPEHDCYRNWKGSATSMEQDIIVKGFNISVETHKLEYRFYIGDGDSSTYPQIRARCHYGHRVTKLHCANHVTVRLSDHLHTLLKKTKEYPVEARNALKTETESTLGQKQTRIERLVKGVRTAIRVCGENNDSVENLQKALQNAPFHAFGRHTNCGDWCPRKNSAVPDKDEVDTARKGGLFQAIQAHVDTLIQKSDSLVRNVTTNAAENFMSLAAKANGGKRIPNWKGGGYTWRIMSATINFSEGPGYHSAAMKEHAGLDDTPKLLKKFSNSRSSQWKRRRESREAEKAAGEPASKRGRRRMGAGHDNDYGPQAALTNEERKKLQEELEKERLELHPDMPEDALEAAKKKVLEHLERQVDTEEKRARLQGLTGQHKSADYRQVRYYALLPSSKFGKVVTRQPGTPCNSLVLDLVYPSVGDKKSVPMQYGIDHEQTAVEKYVHDCEVSEPVAECGLFINPKWPFLASTPDRLLGSEGLIEVKCIFPGTLASRGVHNFHSAASLKGKERKSMSICLEIVDGQLCFKRTHLYYYQIQGQLAITERQYCMAVVFTDSSLVDNWKGQKVEDFYVEKIERDDKFWQETMLPKLSRFYMDCMLVEICLRRKNRGIKCRDPDWIKPKKTKQQGQQQ
ncbi:uncharacterized protein LOC113206748 [Frankliniella occidentalis]|uniref:Uncharacterized protein LOC113206748 n=1 Tax=Frankliniella occidentalis TaxID=133901 RepID=A0A6J1SC51_FRAOC|nr:uncharacterized protein LOC113206748 [Frankliniella occidentalis]